MLETQKIEYFKKRLEEECQMLEEELKSVGAQNPDNPSDWVARGPTDSELNVEEADRSEAGDRMEALGENTAIVNDLEVRYNNVIRALAKINAGTYGMCEIDNIPIEDDRLEVNPSARTCKKHMEEEGSLPQ